MGDAERLHRLAIMIWHAADDPDRVRDMADLMVGITADTMDTEAAAGKPTPAAIARCGRRADA